METIVTLGITLLVLGFVGFPLLRERAQDEDELGVDEIYEDPEVDALLSQKEAALSAIRELEFDHAVGSLSDDDYQQLKDRYGKKAISVLKNLDDLTETAVVSHAGRNRRHSVKAQQARRSDRASGPSCPGCGRPYEVDDVFCASCGLELGVYEEESPVCYECGASYDEGNVFCSSCGAELAMLEQEPERTEEDIPRDLPSVKAAKEPSSVQSNGTARRRRRYRSAGRPRGAAKSD